MLLSRSRTRHLRSARFSLSFVLSVFGATAWSQPQIDGMYTRNGVVGLEAQPPENPMVDPPSHPR